MLFKETNKGGSARKVIIIKKGRRTGQDGE
jgi:hypothetical protein